MNVTMFEHPLITVRFTEMEDLSRHLLKMEILEQSPIFYSVKKGLPFQKESPIPLSSSSLPELTDGCIFLRGTSKGRDNNVSAKTFGNAISRKAYLNNALSSFSLACNYFDQVLDECDYSDDPKKMGVSYYCKMHDKGDLTFGDGVSCTLSGSIKDNIINILDYCKRYDSWCDGHIETSPGRLRSSLDLWRHYRSLDPTITIFQVMNALHDLWKEQSVYTHFCSTVNRRVFKRSSSSSSGEYVDEYGLTLPEWKDL